jgi:hypothetical protein
VRIRTIKPEFWVSESMGRLSRDARLIFVGLWSLADDYGRFRADPRLIAGQLLPYDPDGAEVASRALASLREEGCIVLYEAERSQYGAVTGWERHQRIDRPSASRLPQPPETTIANIRQPAPSPREPSALEQGTGNREQGTGKKEEDPASSPPPIERGPLVFVEPDAPTAAWTGQDFFAWFQVCRQNAGLVGEKWPKANLGSWWSEVLMTPGMSVERLQSAVRAFGQSKHWRGKGLPFTAFMSMWREFVPAMEAA